MRNLQYRPTIIVNTSNKVHKMEIDNVRFIEVLESFKKGS